MSIYIKFFGGRPRTYDSVMQLGFRQQFAVTSRSRYTTISSPQRVSEKMVYNNVSPTDTSFRKI